MYVLLLLLLLMEMCVVWSLHRMQGGKFTLKNTLSSINVARTKNTAYINRHVWPSFRFKLNLLSENAMYSSNNVDNNDIAEYSKPCELMPTQ